jgi:hypothetical protein
MKPLTTDNLETTANRVLAERQGKKGVAKEINTLLNNAFGVGVFSKVYGDSSHFSYGSTRHPDGKLEQIYQTFFGFMERYIGEFKSEDGSELKILPQYARQIAIYADLYEKKYGKKVEIKLIKD